MAKGSGRKVYRNVQYAKKKRVKKFFIVLLSIIILAVLVFVGYSIAKPIFNFFSTEQNEVDNTLPWTPPVTEKMTENEEITEFIEEENNIPQENTDISEPHIEMTDDFTAYMLPVDALMSGSKLIEYVNQAKAEGYNAIVVTLKSNGGKIHYSTESEFAKTDESTVIGTMPAAQICQMIKDNGLKAFALINLLEDNSRYGENRDGSYHSLDGSTWLDNSVSNGGKPWLSPFENDTISYVAFLTNEIISVGFDAVITDGIMFPNFRNSDLNLIGNSVKSDDRYNSLINLVTLVSNLTESRNIKAIHTFNANKVINDLEEAFKPDMLNGKTILIEYSAKELSNTVVFNNNEIILSDLSEYEKFKAVWEIVKEKAGKNIELIPLITHSEFNQADYDAIVTELISQEYKSYIVK